MREPQTTTGLNKVEVNRHKQRLAIADDAGTGGKWFNTAMRDGILQVTIFDEIDRGGEPIGSLADELEGQTDARLVVRDCPGGDSVFAHLFYEMYFGKFAETKIFGLCASAAISIALCGRKVKMHRDARLLLHCPYTLVVGGAVELLAHLQVLQDITQRIFTALKIKTEQPDEIIASWLDGADIYLDAQAAFAFGLVDEIFDLPPVQSKPAAPVEQPAVKAAQAPSEKPWTDDEEFHLDLQKASGTILTHDPARFFRELNIIYSQKVKTIEPNQTEQL
jgi:ATP-dependent protease ClpP protease subunit